jgi:hypothetical protein
MKHNLIGHSTSVEKWALPREEELAGDSNNLTGSLTPFLDYRENFDAIITSN